jgi:LemA protein
VSVTVIVVLVVLVVLAGLAVGLYNGLVRRRNQVDAAWSQIEVQLKRRLDLVPNLVETVKGSAAFERGALEAVIAARSASMQAPSDPAAQARADGALSGALRQLFALSEAYPDLKSNANYLGLQEELSTTESRIAYARQFYNDAVLAYNTAIQSFPGVLAASAFNFGPRAHYDAEPAADAPPQVRI